jgi:hypothetical protein
MYGSAPDLISIYLSNGMLFTAFAVNLDGRTCLRWPSGRAGLSGHRRGDLAAHLQTACVRGHDEQLVSRWPAIPMLFAHGTLFLLRTPMVAVLPATRSNDVNGSV